MRTPLIPLSIILLTVFLSCAGCGKRGGPTSERDSRWSISPELVIVKSFQELMNVFAAANREYTWTMETTVDPDFVVFSRYAHSGIRSFEVYSYEKVVDGFWHLRSVSFFHASDSMAVQVQKTNSAVRLSHDGEPLFTIQSAARQLGEQTKSPMAREGKTGGVHE